MGKYISGKKINSRNCGTSVLFLITFSKPAPKLVPINNCGVMPINVPKKKFLDFILNKTGIKLEITKGIPPINL